MLQAPSSSRYKPRSSVYKSTEDSTAGVGNSSGQESKVKTGKTCYIHLTLAMSTSLISNNRLSRSKNLVPA